MVFHCELSLDDSRCGYESLSFIFPALGQRLKLTDVLVCEIERATIEALAFFHHPGSPSTDTSSIMLRINATLDSLKIMIRHEDTLSELITQDSGCNEIPGSDAVDFPDLPICSRVMDRLVYHRSSDSTESPEFLMEKYWSNDSFSSDGPMNVRDLRALLNVGHSMAANMDLTELLRLIVDELATTIEAERATLYLVDDANNQLYSHVLSRDTGNMMEVRLMMGEGLAGHVACTGETINIRQAYQDPRFHATYDRITGFVTKSVLVMPLSTPQGKIIGVVQLLNKQSGQFTAADEHLLAVMAAQAAVRIENTRLYAQEIHQKIVHYELETARQIQESFLPHVTPDIPGFDIVGACQYCHQTGGDYYDVFFPVEEQDNRFVVLVGDVSGHGLSAALLMATARALIRLRASMPGQPAEIIRDVNRRLSIDTKETGQFMTLFYCDIDRHDGKILWVRAGHDSAVVYDINSDHFDELRGNGIALGLDEAYEYQQFESFLPDTAVMVIGTDGIWEMSNNQDRRFGKSALKEIIKRHARQSARSIINIITEELDEFRGDRESQDDITMVVLKVDQ
jgi:phosphoserine phosphatase RsbU/P